MLTKIDGAISRAIEQSDIESLEAVKEEIGEQFYDSLATLLKSAVDGPQVWGKLGDNLSDVELYQAADQAYRTQISLTPMAKDKAMVYGKMARTLVRQDQRDKAGILYSTAARLAPNVKSFQQQAKALAPELSIRLKEPWKFIPLFGPSPATDYYRALDQKYFPTLYNDMCRNDFAKTYHFNRLDPYFGYRSDCSFVLTNNNVPIARVECDIAGDEMAIKCLEVPIKVFFNEHDDIDDALNFEAFQIAMLALVKIADHFNGITHLWIEDMDVPIATPFSIFSGTRCNLSAVPKERGWIDLVEAAENDFSHIRKGHKSNIKWGKNNLELIDWNDPSDEALLNDYYRLHEAINRYPGYDHPDTLNGSLVNGSLALTIVKCKGVSVGFVLIGYHGASAYYMASISNNANGDPLAHWPLYHRILKSRDKGCTRFDLGYVHPSEESLLSDKEHQISRFKRGFATNFECCKHLLMQIH